MLSRRFRQRRHDWGVHGQLHPMSPITCAACGHTMPAPAAQIGAVGICPACGGSFVIEADGTTRRATAADTTALTPAELQTLRKARGRTR